MEILKNSGGGADVQGMALSNWTLRATPADNAWRGICYSPELQIFVASCAGAGTANRVMTSPDGITWTGRAVPVDKGWGAITWGNGLFVCIASSGTAGQKVITSPDGITWTARTTPADNAWNDVVFANGIFVAVASTGTGNRVMTSPDGITWTLRTTPTTAPVVNALRIIYGNGTFVAEGSGSFMTSWDGINWTNFTPVPQYMYNGIVFHKGEFVGLAGYQIFTSKDAVTWTKVSEIQGYLGYDNLTLGNGYFMASRSGYIAHSKNLRDWRVVPIPTDKTWHKFTYGLGAFVGVASSGSVAGNRVMTSLFV